MSFCKDQSIEARSKSEGSNLPQSSDHEDPPGSICVSCESDDIEEHLQGPDRYHGRRQLYRLVRCRSCSLVWIQNPPAEAEIYLHYGRDYDLAVAAAGKDPRRWQERCELVRQFKDTGCILDLGCSAGGFLAGLEKGRWEMYGVEMSPDVARAAEERTGAEVFNGDILGAPFERETFDVITCFHVFEHLYEPRAVLQKVREWLKPDGIFFTMMPNIDSAGAHIFRSYWYGLELPRHPYHYSPRSLRTLARAVGLEELSISTHREVFIEASMRYILDDLLRKIGVHRVPLAKAPEPSLPFRILRKATRVTLLPALGFLARIAGDGESIHAILKKGTGAGWTADNAT